MHTLTTATESGTYQHRITFTPTKDGSRVAITERTHDELMGDWIGTSQDRTVPVAEARDYYRDRKRMGYR